MISSTASEHQPDPPPSRAHRVLMWPLTRLIIGIILFALFSYLLARVEMSVSRTVFGGRSPSGDGLENTAPEMLLQGIITAPAAVAALLVLGILIERRRPAAFGFARTGAIRDLFIGFGIGAAILSVVIGILAMFGWYRIAGSAYGGAVGGVAILFFAFFLGAIFEEVLTRGIIFRLLEEGMGSWIALALSSLVFGFGHAGNPNMTLTAAIAISIEAGILLAAAYMLTRSLWLAIGIHWGWNFAEGPIFGTRVSGVELPSLVEARVTGPAVWTGGEFGPEAGLVAAIVATTTGVYLLFRAYRLGRFFTPAWMAGGTSKGTTMPPSLAESEAPAASAPSSPP